MDEERIDGAVADAAREGGEPAGEEVAAVREVVLRAYPDVVPDLVAGASVAEVLASVEPARAAYRRVVEAAGAAASSPPGVPSVPSVPAGAVGRPAADPERLPAAEKIRRGLAGRVERRA